MKSKTYRVSSEIAKKISKRNLEYIKKNNVIVSEAKIVAAMIKIGIKREKEGDMEAELNERNREE